MKSIAFFNNKGGVGKTTLVYHLAWMIADQGHSVLAVDLDPQANLTSMFLQEDRLEELWPDGAHPQTIYGALQPIIDGTGDVAEPHIEMIGDRFGLIVGDLALSTFEDRLSDAWPRCHNRDQAAFRTMTAFYRAIMAAARRMSADWILIDVGPNLGAINRAALIASEHVVIPLAPDLFSLQGLRNLGPSLKDWRSVWSELRGKCPNPDLELPSGKIDPLGYVILQHGIRENRPPKAYQRWIERVPSVYQKVVLDRDTPPVVPDPQRLALLKHYRSLMQMAMECRKPVYALKPADGAIGAHGEAVRAAYRDFQNLARIIMDRASR